MKSIGFNFGRVLLFAVVLFCTNIAQAEKTEYRLEELPKYGGGVLPKKIERANKWFVESVKKVCEAEGETLEIASKRQASVGWQSFAKGDHSTAIKRFNQAWLLDPDNRMVLSGFGTIEAERGNWIEAIEFYDQALAIYPDDPILHDQLGMIFLHKGDANPDSRSMKADFQKAIEHFKQAADLEHAIAYHRLGYIHVTGRGTPVDHEQAAKWYQLAASEGNALSQAELAFLYRVGNGVPKDLDESFRLYQLAAKAGLAKAQKSLGDCYYLGWGVEQDYDSALDWYQQAAEKGNRMAYHSLGMMYFQGLGVGKDNNEAFQCFKTGASLNERQAQLRLAVMYELGSGCSKDLIKACMWTCLAEKNGHPKAATLMNKFTKEMTPEQIAEAKRLAEEWLEENDGKR